MQSQDIEAVGLSAEKAEPADQSTIRRVITASAVGTLFEWYDFYLYGSLAVFFGKKFFPEGNDTAQLLASLATFGAGFGVRPLGAVVFGYIGDLRSNTAGRGQFSMEFSHYSPVPKSVLEKVKEEVKAREAAKK